MIPLRDTTPTKNYPVVNNAIIGINIVIFILQLSQGVEWNKFVLTYGLVPARYSIPQISAYFLEIPAYVFLGFWFVLQFINATISQGQAGGVAWWAHIGGFIFGIIFLKILLALPGAESRTKIRRVTARKKSPHLQVIRPVGPGPDPHLYGVISITPHEAVGGTRKLVNIPWGFHKRLFRVVVPPGIKEGSKLRLKGLGKEIGSNDRGARGNLYLKVRIQ